MNLLLLAMAGAAVGAACRWLLDQAVQARHDSVLPWGTFVINVTGSFALGALLGVGDAVAGAAWLALLGAGFCGGFTTFSTFGYETLRLVEDGARLPALLTVAGSVGVGLLAAFAGWWLGTAVGR